MKRARTAPTAAAEDVHIQEFLDMIAPSVIKFETDHFICGNTYRCVWALREYPTATDEQAILSHLGEKDGVTLRIYTRHVTPVEEKKIISNAANKNRMDRSNTNDLQQTVLAESNLQDVTTIVAQMHRNREPLLHAAVYLELCAHDIDQLKLLQTEVLTELIRSKLNVDRLMLRQQQGFQCVMPTGWNLFRDQFERVLPASSVANLYPFNYSGKTDPQGFYIGRDKYIHVLWTARFIPCFRLQWVNDILAAHQVNEAAAEVIGQILVLHLRIERTHPHIGFPQVCLSTSAS